MGFNCRSYECTSLKSLGVKMLVSYPDFKRDIYGETYRVLAEQRIFLGPTLNSPPPVDNTAKSKKHLAQSQMATRMAVNSQNDSYSSYSSFKNAGNSISQHGFKITTRKLPILKAEPIEQMTARLGIAPPEMIFGDNMVSIEYLPTGWGIDFNTFDALDRVDKTGHSMLQVAHSKEWQSTRYGGLERVAEYILC